MHPLVDYVEILKALGDPVRLHMVWMMGRNDETACVALEGRLRLSKSTISYHIKQLRSARLIRIRKEGRFYHYTLLHEVFNQYLPGFLEALHANVDEAQFNLAPGNNGDET